MTRKITIVDPDGTRSVAQEKLPLTIGSAAGADIRVAGAVSDKSFALIDVLDGKPFVQPVGHAPKDRPAVTVNGEAIDTTRWLSSKDVIAVQGTSIECEFGAESGATGVQLNVACETIEYATLPPVVEDVGDATASPTITPVRRKPGVGAPAEAGSRRKAWVIGGGILSVLLVFVFYLFTARSVLIVPDPPDAQIKIAGGLLKLEFDDRYLLRPGDYRVMLTAAGYEPLREEIEVGGDTNQKFEFAMTKLPGRLTVSVLPDVPARLWVDGVDRGALPTGEISLPPGPHAVRIAADRYLDFETGVEIEGLDRQQVLEAELVPGWADVTFVTMPAGAIIYADDEALGNTPATVEIMAGSREVSVQKEGFKIWRRTLEIVANQPQVLPEIALAEADSLLTVTSAPSAAAVSVDGRYRGKTPVDVELGPGRSYKVIISKPGFGTVSREVVMESKRGKSLRVELEPRVGVVTIVSEPADAALYIDGKARGAAGQTLSLPARAHRIEVRKAGFEPFVTELTPKPGLPETLNIRLLTPEQAVLAATPRVVRTADGYELLRVDPGEFELGAPRREQGRRANEAQHRVKLTRAFYLGTREITNSQFRAFKPKHTSGAEKYRQLADGDHPAVMLTWEEATGYCNWLSNKESLPFAYVVEDGKIVLASPPNIGYRLPTEAEWAWAARYNGGGGKRKYPWGDRMPPVGKAGNYADLSARSILSKVLADYNDGYPITAPVGRFPVNPIGIFDLGGNVAEWVNDYYGVHAGGSKVDLDPVGPAEGQYHVIRGSGWRHASISELRFSYRDFGDRGRLDVGFRIARYAEEKGK